jgi:hypothetical protein
MLWIQLIQQTFVQCGISFEWNDDNENENNENSDDHDHDDDDSIKCGVTTSGVVYT